MDVLSEGINALSLFDGKYEVTSEGEVYSNVGRRKRLVGKVTRHGYRMLVLTVNGKKLYKNEHRLVAEAFIPNPLNLPEVNHIDGDKLNNRVSNLEWCTSSQNQLHARDTGLQVSKLCMEDATEIRRLRAEFGYTHKQLAQMFGVGMTQIGYILQNKRWCT